MSDEKETIEDIVAEMRNGPCCWITPAGIPQHSHDNELFYKFADRIEEAYNREREAGAEVEQRDIDTVIRRYGRLVEKLRREKERLLSALNPVLDAYISQDNHSAEVYDSRLDSAVCVRAVREAKRVYGGGEK